MRINGHPNLHAWLRAGSSRPGQRRVRDLDALWLRALGLGSRAANRTGTYMAGAERVDAARQSVGTLADQRLRERMGELREYFRRGEPGAELVHEALACVGEAAKRTLGQEPFVVQLAGALALHAGCVAEMATGEGKTLTAALAAVLAGWRGGGCHVVTVNDYLAARDAAWMGPLLRFCGLKVGAVAFETEQGQRREAYQADVTYTTNKEVAADYLRDKLTGGRVRTGAGALAARMAGAGAGRGLAVLRPLRQAIVDEADSILIDEAVTPLIIAGEGRNAAREDASLRAAALAGDLTEGEHFRVDLRHREVTLTEAGHAVVAERAATMGPVFAGARRREELVVQALAARALHAPGQNYVIQDGRVVIVDEFTGRMMPDRTWREGFHQAVEAKEALEVTPVKETLARISFQRFFGLYPRLAGMTGTARESAAELWRVYNLPVVAIPRNRPSRLRIRPLRVFARSEDRWKAVVEAIEGTHRQGRPVLVGTRTIAASERLGAMLADRGVPHRVLNATRHKEEAEVIAGAGQRGAVTIATNMAGRGTDIRLGQGVAGLGGLQVVLTEPHEAARIDRQFAGRAGRQGDPGTAALFASVEDELVCRFASSEAALARRGRRGDANGSRTRAARWVVWCAQFRAGAFAARLRARVLEADESLAEGLGFTGPTD